MSDPDKLFEQFPRVSTEEWEERIKKDLNEPDYLKRLSWSTADGFSLRPFYRGEDLEGIPYPRTLPSEYPFARGYGNRTNKWKIRQDLYVQDAELANNKALMILGKGVESLGFVFHAEEQNLEGLLRGIPLSQVPLNFETDSDPLVFVERLLSFLSAQKTDPSKITGSLSHDPLTDLCLYGPDPDSSGTPTGRLTELYNTARRLSGFRLISIRGDRYHNAGVTATQELAYSLATGAEYLSALTDAGLKPEQAASRIQFHFGTGSSFFMEIAKLRAARFLWAHIVNSWKPEEPGVCRSFIHASASLWNQTVYDPYTNILRGTTEAMSAILGGADSVTVVPFDHPFRYPAEFSERIARNIQIILREESYLDKVIDPGAGSYYIENMTHSLVCHAWDLFLETERNGGLLSAIKNNRIQPKISEATETRLKNIAARREVLVGTNDFPDLEEKTTDRADPWVYGLDPVDLTGRFPYYELRGASELEALRLETERNGPTPSVFMFTYGRVNMRRARAAFSSNFFGCGGFRVIDSPGFSTLSQGLEAVRHHKPDIVVLCSSDDEYPGMAESIGGSLPEGTILVVAGYPRGYADRLGELGIEHYIHAGSDLLEELRRFRELICSRQNRNVAVPSKGEKEKPDNNETRL